MVSAFQSGPEPEEVAATENPGRIALRRRVPGPSSLQQTRYYPQWGQIGLPRWGRLEVPESANMRAVDGYRPWHLPGCPARDAAVALGACTCPPERWLDAFARPVPEAETGAGGGGASRSVQERGP